MKTKLLIAMLFSLVLSTTAQAQWTAIPDSNFEQALIDLGIDDVLDGQVLTASVENITYLDVIDKNISDLTGIEAFISLQFLRASNNFLQTINTSTMPELETLIAMVNEITSLDLSQNTSLKKLLFNNNKLTEIGVSNNLQLEELVIGANNLSSVDVSNNQLLKDLFLMENQQISSIDVSSNPLLEKLFLRNCNINQIDLNSNIQLKELSIDNNQISNLDLSNNINLEMLLIQGTLIETIDLNNNNMIKVFAFSDTPITSFDFSILPNLEQLIFTRSSIIQIDLSSNQHIWEVYGVDTPLESLNLKNGVNHLITNFYITSNPNLTCIQVDDAAWSTANWTAIDPQMYFSEDCSGGAYTEIPDPYFEQALIDLGIDDVLDGQVLTASVDTVTVLDVSDKNIENLVGLEAFLSLKELFANSNNISSVDISQNTMLIGIGFIDNELTAINTHNNTVLKFIGVGSNNIDNVDFSNNPLLELVYLSSNNLNSLDVSNLSELKELGIDGNSLSSIDVTQNNKLKFLYASDNLFTEIDVSNNSQLERLSIYNQNIQVIDVTNNPKLQGLWAFNCQLTNLDLSFNSELISLHCQNNNLGYVNLKNGNNMNFIDADFSNNPNLTCIQVDDAAYSTANWTNLDPQMYFSEFCGATGDDSDGDGVPDDFDDFPMDELRAFDNYFPATGYGSLAFEDLWPGTGDYDFNDVVVDYRFEMVTNASNKVVEVFGSFVLKASGASLRNGFGFNLPTASTNLINNLNEVQVSGHQVTAPFVSLMENGFEAGQSKPTIIVFDDFYNVMEHPGSGLGINTEADKPFVAFDTLNLLIKPNEAIFGLSEFQFENWNPFIIVNNDRSREVHLADHAPTDLVDMSIFGSYEDSTDPSIGRYYKTSNNLPWAIHIIQEFVWPQEKISIVEAYNHFFEWANSSGTEYDDWYENHNGYRDDDKLYLHE